MNPPLPREHFEVTANYNYLNHAAVGVLPARSKAALDAFVHGHASAGVMGVWQYEARMPEYRAAVASFINAKPGEIALLRNTGDGANVLGAGIDWRPGDEILTNDNEFPSNAYPWLACEMRGAKVRFVDTSQERMTPDVLRKHITPRTRVVTVSWVGFHDGYRHDLAGLARVAHAHGALFFVDVIQGLGAFPLDVTAMDIDAAYGGGAKWMMALQGVSFLYVRESLIERLALAAPGWRSADDMWDFLNYAQPKVEDASRFEGGTPNFIGGLSMLEAIAELEPVRERIGHHVIELTDRLVAGLEEIGATIASVRGPHTSSGIVTFSVPGADSVALGKLLQAERIVTTYRSTGVRVAPHGYNTAQEIDHLLDVTKGSLCSRSFSPSH